MKTNLSILLLLQIIMASANNLMAAEYYFSNEIGNDSRSMAQAQNPSTPWKSIQKLNSIMSSLRPGDAIYFRRGEAYYGTIQLAASGTSGSPIVIGAYGSGERPLITGLIELTNWRSIGNGIHESSHQALNTDELNIVLLNKSIQEMGRYPNSNSENKGYLTYESHSGNTSITDNELSSSPNWTGGEVVIRKIYWITDRHTITSHSGTRINYSSSSGSNYNPRPGFGYFIQNHPETLDQLGEWYYNPSTKKLNVYFGQHSPSNHRIQASALNHLLTNNGLVRFVNIKDLHFQGANQSTISLTGGNDISLDNCIVEFSGENGISISGTQNLKVQNSEIKYSNNNGIDLRSTDYAIIRDNLVKDTYVFPGMGNSGDGTGIGIYTRYDNNIIEYNKVINTGYIGIRFGGNNTVVKNNIIDYFCVTKNDGGGIYAYTGNSNRNYTNRKVIGNIILNGIGVREGTNITSALSLPQTEGIYLDDNTSGVEVTRNTIANITSKGIYLHNARDININNNIVFNSANQLLLRNDHMGDNIRNITVNNNIFTTKAVGQNNLNIQSVQNDIDQMGTFDNNIYGSPLSDNFTILNRYLMGSSNEVNVVHDLNSWKKTSKKDQNSKLHPVDIPTYEVKSLIGENKYDNESFDTHANYISCNGCTSSWLKNSDLDNGALKVTGSGSFESTFNIGEIDSNKTYILRFSAKGNKDFPGKVYLRQRGTPWQNLSAIHTIEFNNKRQEYEVLIDPVSSFERTSVLLRFENIQNLELQVDNFKFHEAKVALTDPNEHIFFEFNPSKSNKTVVLQGEYVDMKNNVYKGSVTIPPFSSLLLVKISDNDSPDQAEEINTGESMHINLGSNTESEMNGTQFKGERLISNHIAAPSYSYTNEAAADQPIFQTERNADELKVAIPISNGTYTVFTYHNELWFGHAGPSARAGRRVFDIEIENELVKKDFDIFVENANRPTVLSFQEVEVKDGILNINMKASNNRASLTGLSVVQKGTDLDISIPQTQSWHFNTGNRTDVQFKETTYLGDVNFQDYFNQSYTFSNSSASADPLFQTERNGETLMYSIPVPNGTYTVETYHNELWFGHSGPSARAGRRVFDIEVEGEVVMKDFDIFTESGNKPIVNTFNQVQVKDGVLNINMTASSNRASISGLSIYPESISINSSEAPLSFTNFINTGGLENTEFQNSTFNSETKWENIYDQPSYRFSNTNASEVPLFQTERNADNLIYNIPVPNGTYTIMTFHNELWFGHDGPSAQANRRVFDIELEGIAVKKGFDIFVENNNKPTALTFNDIDVKDGMLNIKMTASRNRASISGIAIIAKGVKTALDGANLRGYREMTSEDAEARTDHQSHLENTRLEVNIFPNPAREKINLRLNKDIGIKNILIHNMNGQLVAQFYPEHVREDQGLFTLPVANLSKGVYLLSTVGEREILSQHRLLISQ